MLTLKVYLWCHCHPYFTKIILNLKTFKNLMKGVNLCIFRQSVYCMGKQISCDKFIEKILITFGRLCFLTFWTNTFGLTSQTCALQIDTFFMLWLYSKKIIICYIDRYIDQIKLFRGLSSINLMNIIFSKVTAIFSKTYNLTFFFLITVVRFLLLVHWQYI